MFDIADTSKKIIRFYKHFRLKLTYYVVFKLTIPNGQKLNRFKEYNRQKQKHECVN